MRPARPTACLSLPATPYPLYFDIDPNSLATPQNLSAAFSSKSILFVQNTRGGYPSFAPSPTSQRPLQAIRTCRRAVRPSLLNPLLTQISQTTSANSFCLSNFQKTLGGGVTPASQANASPAYFQSESATRSSVTLSTEGLLVTRHSSLVYPEPRRATSSRDTKNGLRDTHQVTEISRTPARKHYSLLCSAPRSN